jgi:hypothetical protein
MSEVQIGDKVRVLPHDMGTSVEYIGEIVKVQYVNSRDEILYFFADKSHHLYPAPLVKGEYEKVES